MSDWRHVVSALMLAVVIGAVALPLRTARPPDSDGIQNVTVATNIVVDGVYSSQRPNEGLDPVADHRREPVYPTLLAAALATSSTTNIDVECMLRAQPECQAVLRRLRLVNVGLLVALALATMWLAATVGFRPWLAAVIGGAVGLSTTFTSDVDRFFNTLAATVLLTIAGNLLYRIGRGDRGRGLIVAAGVALGLLMLTRAAFFYSSVALLPLALVVGRPQARRLAGQSASVLAVAYLVTTPWLARNVVTVGSAAVSGGAGMVLAVRAEASTMDWGEYPLAFVAYTPEAGPAVLDRTVDDGRWQRWDRRYPGSFYRLALGLDDGGVVQTRGGLNPSAGDGGLSRAALEVIADHPTKYVALSLPYAWRGAFVEAGRTPLLAQDTAASRVLARFVAPLTILATIALFPLAGVALVQAWRRRQVAVVMLASLSLGSWLFHVLLTHYIRRYSHPLVPTLVVLALVTVSSGRRFRSVLSTRSP